MLALLARQYSWPRMEEDVDVYVRIHLVCQLDKVDKKKEDGLLQPLPVQEGPWKSVSMDFISDFPKVNDIIGDSDARFTGRFWMTLFNMMGTELKFSIANHPQTDSQTERMNVILEDYLRHYVWLASRIGSIGWTLPNLVITCISRRLRVLAFEVAYRQQSLTPHEIPVQKSGEKCPVAYQFARSMQELLDEVKDSLAKAQRRMKKYTDMRKRQMEFSVGDQVLLKLTL
ncbi:UNVERIFIED_CONTAM: Transposon Ty3-I Gag-Pol polyprotein [Sesamum angustifolium]|uniref:Transposon Ty3-I Gag-Pol polyprotein n=1 Tax=Sesamum angustifolium TaxID=2727405 RepID=A0AAW2NN99_9LAMI